MHSKSRSHLIISAALLTFFVFILPGCGRGDVGDLKEKLKREKAKRQENSEKYKEALRKFSEERKRVKQLEDLLVALGERLEEEGKSFPDELAKLREKKIESRQANQEQEPDPKKAVGRLIKLGDELYAKGEYPAATEVYTSAIEIETEDTDLYHRLGRSFIKTSQHDKAIPVYEKVVKMLGKNGPTEKLRQAHNNLGWLYTQKNRFNEAELAYLRAIKADPGYANAYYNLGLLYDLYLEDEIGAIEAFEKYIELKGQKSDSVRKRLREIRER
ncbi:MAG: tetratricopeptide repeat protein [Candidatus Brocadiales bacterium]|nr:tetratricopeptide repeat protein [Candidatus Bathyanammoxibius amoris]